MNKRIRCRDWSRNGVVGHICTKERVLPLQDRLHWCGGESVEEVCYICASVQVFVDAGATALSATSGRKPSVESHRSDT